MSGADGALVLLGVGNELLRDDGVGIHVIRELERRRSAGTLPDGAVLPDGAMARGGATLPDGAKLPDGTEIVDGGTLGADAMPWIQGARGLVLVDAAELGAAPGTVAILRGEALAHAATASPGGVASILGAARLAGIPPHAISLVGVQPAGLEPGLELTPPVRDALPAALAVTVDALRSMASSGHRPTTPAGSPGTAEPEVRA